jgi:hypothetical protein
MVDVIRGACELGCLVWLRRADDDLAVLLATMGL